VRAVPVLFAFAIACSGCGDPIREKHLDPGVVRVTTDAKMRTDTVGDGQFAEVSTFVLVDAENTATEGAYVTLAGTLADGSGAVVGTLKPQSLWIPAGASRTYALIDDQRKPRASAVGARIEVRGALVPAYGPVAQLTDQKQVDDGDKVLISAKLTNPTDRPARIVVIAAFKDRDQRPMTRPFDAVALAPKQSTYVQYVGPRGSKQAQIFLGDESY
jgi:hypothetical protein